MGYNWAKRKMKKNMIVLGLSAFLSCGTILAMDYPNNCNNLKTELNNSQDCDGCVVKRDRVNEYTHKDEIQITNNCSDDVIVEFDYWTGSKWIHSSYTIGANTTSVWIPAESYKNYQWHWA